ncbi:AI-2E family transporter [Halarchaeum sp. CBA1220]|uniref:AI-2E family transporter n=1 Tax=Halarchaeum sp. CBA1220 TaxID=1853682 RepID=UPI001313FE76|nr:AI-2E family transporter [Halarchaeum sp. CBA1220]QLC33005.1 AI-2E family transporter [Halarchaeum sp. CBA1220]
MSVEDWIPAHRERVVLWGIVLALAGVVAFTLYSFVGTVVLGLFIYYGVRPVYRRLDEHLPGGPAALCTLLLVALPFFLVAAYLGVMGFHELLPRIRNYQTVLRPYVDVDPLLQQPVTEFAAYLRDPASSSLAGLLEQARHYVDFVSNALMNLMLAALFAFYLLRDGDSIRRWFRGFAGSDTTTVAYASAVDQDLETMYSGTVLMVFVVAVGAFVAYHAYNFLAPPAVAIPFPTALAVATGLTTLIPLIVGKVVYLPLVGYLGYSALRSPDASLVFPAALLVVCFVFLDFLPMTFVLPELAGRGTHVGLVLFGYIVGTMVFGWYGLFLGPLCIVLCVQAVRIILEPLVHGERVTGDVDTAEGLGSDPP